MLRRIDELVELRPAVAAGSSSACDTLRAIGQALRGSGGTFGFHQLTAAAGLVETASDPMAALRLEGLLVELRDLVGDRRRESRRAFEWLEICAGLGDEASVTVESSTLAEAWAAVVDAGGLTDSELTHLVAERFGIEPATLTNPSRTAWRLVPEAFMVSAGVVPLSEDSTTITVASAAPVSLAVELELGRLTGRRPVLAVAPPQALHAVLGVGGVTGAEVVGLGAEVPAEQSGQTRAVDEAAPLVEGTDADGDLRASPTSWAERSGSRMGAPTRAPDEPIGVLVVDDEPSARLLVRALLEKRGFDTLEASDGLEALSVIGEHDHIALAIVDLNMPNMDGLELIWELRDRRRWTHLPVIVVTGEKDEILETQIMEEGADDYIRKPVDPRLFLARVDATLRRVGHSPAA